MRPMSEVLAHCSNSDNQHPCMKHQIMTVTTMFAAYLGPGTGPVYTISVLIVALQVLSSFYSTWIQDSEAIRNVSQGHTACEWQSEFLAQISLVPGTVLLSTIVTSWRQGWWVGGKCILSEEHLSKAKKVFETGEWNLQWKCQHSLQRWLPKAGKGMIFPLYAGASWKYRGPGSRPRQ